MREVLFLKSGVRRLLRLFGLQFCRIHGPVMEGSIPISGSFPPYHELNTVGSRESYFIHNGYEHREEYSYYNDTAETDGWQNEVYQYAKEIADQFGLQTVADVGCGSAHKLMKYLGDRTTIGLDVEETCKVLRSRFPGRRWMVSDLKGVAPEADLVIASDVIEHVLHPDRMLEFILRMNPKYVVISTPDRNLIRKGSHNGPPSNVAHIREWSMAELHAYVSGYLDIAEHFHSNAAQCTQCILARPRTERA